MFGTRTFIGFWNVSPDGRHRTVGVIWPGECLSFGIISKVMGIFCPFGNAPGGILMTAFLSLRLPPLWLIVFVTDVGDLL